LLAGHIHDLVELIKKFADESYIQSLLEGEYDFGNGVTVSGEVGARFALSQVIFLLICKYFYTIFFICKFTHFSYTKECACCLDDVQYREWPKLQRGQIP